MSDDPPASAGSVARGSGKATVSLYFQQLLLEAATSQNHEEMKEVLRTGRTVAGLVDANDLPVAARLSQTVLCLPIHHAMTPDDTALVVDTLRVHRRA